MDINFRYNLLKRNVSENSEIEHKLRKLIGFLMYAMYVQDLSLSINILN